MGAGPAFFLVGVALTVVVIAGYLILIALILQRVSSRLNTILSAVDDVIERAEPAGPVIDDINRDLGSARENLEACVQRLEARLAPAEETEGTGGRFSYSG